MLGEGWIVDLCNLGEYRERANVISSSGYLNGMKDSSNPYHQRQNNLRESKEPVTAIRFINKTLESFETPL